MKSLLSRTCLLLLALAVASVSRAAEPAGAPAMNPCASRREAMLAANALAKSVGGTLVLTSGTRSMEPLVHGRTYVVTKRPFRSIARQDILLYRGRPDATKSARRPLLHRAVLPDRSGWLMSGDNNRWSESWDRVTPDTYFGTVVAIFSFPQV